VLSVNSLVLYLLYLINPGLIYAGFAFIAISISCLAPFIDTPSMLKSGALNYLSAMLIMEREKKGVVQLHGGTLLEYTFYFEQHWSAQQRKRFVLKQFTEGILALLTYYEQHDRKPEFTGTSYILNTATLEKFGFITKPINGIQHFILFFNYIPLTIANSLVHKKLRFPNLRKTTTFKASYDDLKTNELKLQLIKDKL
jgi:hypothetical protein